MAEKIVLVGTVSKFGKVKDTEMIKLIDYVYSGNPPFDLEASMPVGPIEIYATYLTYKDGDIEPYRNMIMENRTDLSEYGSNKGAVLLVLDPTGIAAQYSHVELFDFVAEKGPRGEYISNRVLSDDETQFVKSVRFI